jgi:membrane protein implicated in regulation of membrane protease activity
VTWTSLREWLGIALMALGFMLLPAGALWDRGLWFVAASLLLIGGVAYYTERVRRRERKHGDDSAYATDDLIGQAPARKRSRLHDPDDAADSSDASGSDGD